MVVVVVVAVRGGTWCTLPTNRLPRSPLSRCLPQALWRRLQQLRPDFFTLYLGYHHFRSKVSGWGKTVGWAG